MNAYNQLIAYNIKPSVQRIAIMEYILTHRTHPSADEVYSNLSSSMPTLSRTTVYNTLKLFAENGAALLLTIDEKNICFDGDTSPHSHFLCKKCGTIYDLPLISPERKVMETDVDGYLITQLHYYYKGVCKKCLTDLNID